VRRTVGSRRSAPARRRRLGFTTREHVLAVALFATVTVLFFFFAVFRGETYSDVAGLQARSYPWAPLGGDSGRSHLLHPDQSEGFYPWQVFANRALRDGELPLWNPYSFAGTPFLANGQSGVLYPPRVVLALTVSPTRVHDVLLASHLFVAALGMFLLLGFVGLPFSAAVVGALAWMLNSFALSWQALEHYVAIEAWMPIGVLLAHAMVRRRSWAAAFGLALVLGLLFLGGNVLFVELAVVAIFGYAVALGIVQARSDWRSAAGSAARLAAAAILFVGLSAVSLLPTLAVTGESARASPSYGALDEFALDWELLANVFLRPDLGRGDPYHQNLFAGTAVGLLALVGLVRRHALARVAAVLGVVTILFMLHTPVTFVVDHSVPGLDNLKPLARAAFLLQFALAVLAAFGLESVLEQLRSAGRADRQGRRVARLWGELSGSTVLAAFLIGFLGGATVDRLIVHYGGGRFAGGAGFILALATAPGAALGFLFVLRRSDWIAAAWARLSSRLAIGMPAIAIALAAAIAASIVGQAWLWKKQVMLHQPNEPARLLPRTPLIRYLENAPEATFLPVSSFRGSTAMVYPLRSAGGYESLLPARIENVWRTLGDGMKPRKLAAEPLIYAYYTMFELPKLRPRLLARAGVAYVVTPPAGKTDGVVPEGLELRYQGRDGRVFAVEDAQPDVYVVGACEAVKDALPALERFVADPFDPSRAVILEQPFLSEAGASCPSGPTGSAGTAAVLNRSLNSLDVRVKARRTGWLVVSESWDDGWVAEVDDRKAAVLPANYAFRAVRVPAGAHTVRFSYEPASFRVGATVSAVSLAVVLGALAMSALMSLRGARRRR
jgi:hypothetical protein